MRGGGFRPQGVLEADLGLYDGESELMDEVIPLRVVLGFVARQPGFGFCDDSGPGYGVDARGVGGVSVIHVHLVTTCDGGVKCDGVLF